MNSTRKSYPTDVSDAEWEFLLPYLTLLRHDAPQRAYDLREVFNALRYVIKTGCQWRMLPHDFPDWTVVYQGYTGTSAAQQAEAHGIRLEVVKHTEAKRGFVLLPRRWVVERTFGWLGRFRRLARDYERLAEVLAGWHWLAFLMLAVKNVV